MEFLEAMDLIRRCGDALHNLTHDVLVVVHSDLPQAEKDEKTAEEMDRVAALVHDDMHTLGLGAKGELSLLKHAEDE